MPKTPFKIQKSEVDVPLVILPTFKQAPKVAIYLYRLVEPHPTMKPNARSNLEFRGMSDNTQEMRRQLARPGPWP